MGGSGSTRRVVVEQSDGSGVVKISESVVKRLKGEPEYEDVYATRPRQTTPPEVSSTYSLQKKTEAERSAVKELENFYKEKLQELDAKNDLLRKTQVDQFARAVQEVEKKFMKHTASPVCQDLQNKVYNCYIENECKTLKCAKDVRAFTSCVERARQSAINRKGCP